MPIYEYECGNCRFRFEKKQGFDDKPEAVCPQCKEKAYRVFHPAPIIFKGNGFYITDSRSSLSEAVTGKQEAGKKEKTKGK